MTTTPAFPTPDYVAPGTPEAAGIHNDTLLPNFDSYFRYNAESHGYEWNTQIDPRHENATWREITSAARDRMTSGNAHRVKTIGSLAHEYLTTEYLLNKLHKEFSEYKTKARNAINTIGDRLITESNDRQWCSEFDQIIDDVNSELPFDLQLPTRSKDYVVTWTETYTVTVERSETVHEMRDEDQAIDYVRENAEALSGWDLQNYSFQSCEWEHDNGDFEAEED